MSRPNLRNLRRFWTTLAVLSGCTFQYGWIPSCQGALTTVNPCGTILTCLPEDIDLIFSDIPNWDLDPTCTIPGFGFGAPDTPVPTSASGGCANEPVYPDTPGPRP